MSKLRATKEQCDSCVISQDREQLLNLAHSLLFIIITIVMLGCSGGQSKNDPVTVSSDAPANAQLPAKKELPRPAVTPTSQPQLKPKNQTATDESKLVDDDGKTLWVSPTHGKPLNLAYLPPGTQIIAVLRPAALLKHPESEKLRAAFGPNGQAQINAIEHVIGMPLTEIERLVVGAQTTSDDKWMVTFVAQPTNAISQDALVAKLPGATEKKFNGKTYWLANDRAYYLPPGRKRKLLVVAPPDAMADIIDLGGNPPPLRRDIERLIDHTDSDRLATIIVAPNTLFSEAQSVFNGELTRLRGPLFWFLGDELSGAALSLHWDENFFLELIATPTLDTGPERAARIFMERVGNVPKLLGEYVAALSPQPYDKELIGRFPTMVQKLAAYTRSGFERDHAVLRCYLPVVAGHNLLMAAELTLAEVPNGKAQLAAAGGKTSASPDTTGAPATTPAGVHDRLAKVTSLRFTKDTLEAALEQLSQDIGIPIVIRGPDLQADGITKNQSFGIDLSNKPAEEILVQILRLANPDKSATGPSDAKQKLVYTIEQKPDKTEQIVITTRAKAADRHNELPAAFRAAKP